MIFQVIAGFFFDYRRPAFATEEAASHLSRQQPRHCRGQPARLGDDGCQAP